MEELAKVRLDKWLWAARFFKTRSIAKQAVDGGKVRVNGDRAKASKDIECGMKLTIRKGWDDVTVEVFGLSEQRRGAPEAQKLYRETEESVDKRQLRTEERRAFGGSVRSDTKPTTKERRHLQRIKRAILDED